MKKSLLLSSAAILLFGMTQNFDGQEMSQSRRQLPDGGTTVIAQQSKMAQAPFYSRQEPTRWATDQTLPDRHRMAKPRRHRDDEANATMIGKNLSQHELSAGVDTAWVRHYGSGLLPSGDKASAVAVDGAGNIYVTGSSVSAPSGLYYLTIKYDPSGIQLWVARYNGPGNAYDFTTALAVDASGNVYVTGGMGTVKYNSEGVQQWVARYTGSFWTAALAVDASGNVYVTGSSYGSDTDYDYAMVKYNSAGIEQWFARYNGSGNAEDWASAIAVDTSGNVYVTGRSTGSGTLYDYATVKYNSAGVQQWVARYNGPGNAVDWASAIAVDISGNVYVTGGSLDSGTRFDYATVKYSSAGAEQWVARYNGPENSGGWASAIAVDTSGNVYVTGTSEGDYATVKYNSAGVQQWVARYNGPGNDGDYATALAVDASGNVYVTGESWGSGTVTDYATVKYNSAGVEQWVARYNGPENSGDAAEALALDASGNVYVTGSSVGSGTWLHFDYATIKYNSAGIEQWVARYNGPGNSEDYATALALDASGNVYVTGGGGTVKYNSEGVQQWVVLEGATALALDASGNVYVTGGMRTIKYNSEGVQQWVARYTESFCTAALAVDAFGNVYVTGESWDLGTDYDYATVKYNSAGVQQWVARYNGPGGPGNAYDVPTALAVDASGNVYVTGSSRDSDAKPDYATVKYNSAGIQQWVARYNAGYNAYALAVDASGNVYVTGGGGTVKYNSEGVQQWVVLESATALALDASGNVYVTGGMRTIKYNSEGVQQWVVLEGATALALDASGNVYVTGWSLDSGTGLDYDYATVKYSSAGVQQWIARYNGPGNVSDTPVAVAVDGSGNVYVTGSSAIYQVIIGVHTPWGVYTTIKYVQTSVSVDKEEPINPNHYWLAQNYPNPFNPSTTIVFAMPKSAFITLKVYNLLGEEVATLVAEQRAAGIHKFNWDARGLASGVYLYQLEAVEFVQTKKLILMR